MTIVNIPVRTIVKGEWFAAGNWRNNCMHTFETIIHIGNRADRCTNANEMGRKIDSTLPISHHRIIETRANHVICLQKGVQLMSLAVV